MNARADFARLASLDSRRSQRSDARAAAAVGAHEGALRQAFAPLRDLPVFEGGGPDEAWAFLVALERQGKPLIQSLRRRLSLAVELDPPEVWAVAPGAAYPLYRGGPNPGVALFRELLPDVGLPRAAALLCRPHDVAGVRPTFFFASPRPPRQAPPARLVEWLMSHEGDGSLDFDAEIDAFVVARVDAEAAVPFDDDGGARFLRSLAAGLRKARVFVRVRRDRRALTLECTADAGKPLGPVASAAVTAAVTRLLRRSGTSPDRILDAVAALGDRAPTGLLHLAIDDGPGAGPTPPGALVRSLAKPKAPRAKPKAAPKTAPRAKAGARSRVGGTRPKKPSA